ncbi:unnamed protein product, partial [Pylaiella littoralis]
MSVCLLFDLRFCLEDARQYIISLRRAWTRRGWPLLLMIRRTKCVMQQYRVVLFRQPVAFQSHPSLWSPYLAVKSKSLLKCQTTFRGRCPLFEDIVRCLRRKTSCFVDLPNARRNVGSLLFFYSFFVGSSQAQGPNVRVSL